MADGFSIESGGGLSTIEHTTAEMAEAANSHNISMSSGATGKRTVRLVYCSDGVLEECDEDVEEQKRLEKEAAEKELEERRKMDLEAKNLTWLPWMGYMVKKGAIRTFEACDYAGEKLAWWFGITQPKFAYEIREYEAMMKEQERRAQLEDPTEEIVIGATVLANKSFDPEQPDEPSAHFAPPIDNSDVRLYEQNEQQQKAEAANRKPLFQN